jgi:hypothetical protein
MLGRCLQNNHLFAGKGKLAGNGQADDACADDNNINLIQKNA